MKKILILGSILVFAYAAFVPPEGMSKIPFKSVEVTIQNTHVRLDLGAEKEKPESQTAGEASDS